MCASIKLLLAKASNRKPNPGKQIPINKWRWSKRPFTLDKKHDKLKTNRNIFYFGDWKQWTSSCVYSLSFLRARFSSLRAFIFRVTAPLKSDDNTHTQYYLSFWTGKQHFHTISTRWHKTTLAEEAWTRHLKGMSRDENVPPKRKKKPWKDNEKRLVLYLKAGQLAPCWQTYYSTCFNSSTSRQLFSVWMSPFLPQLQCLNGQVPACYDWTS